MALFELSEERTMNICGFEFNLFHVKDKKTFDEVYFSVGYESLVWENSFVYLFSFAQSMTSKNKEVLLWRFVGEHLMVFVHNYKSGRMYLYANPVSKNNDGNFKKDMRSMVKMLDKINTRTFTAGDYFVLDKFNTILDRKTVRELGGRIWSSYDDFIFKCDDLINLEGKKYKGRRSMVNRFKREHPNHVVRLMEDDDYDDVMAVRNLWIDSRFESTQDVWDYEIFPYTLKHRNDFGTRVFVIEVEGTIQGFFIMAKLGNNCSIILNENTNLEFKGMTEYLWYESLRNSKDLGEYENDGNGGKKGDGLYNYKLDHHPVCIITKIGYALNKAGNRIDYSVFK